MNKASSNYLLFILLGIAVVSIFAYSWVPGGLDTDSCNYGVVAKEVVRANKWLQLYDPVYQGVFYYHFPLCIWITALFFKFLGVSSFTAKLFSLTSGVALVVTVFYFGRLLKNRWAGFFAGLSLLFTNHIIRLARQSRMDIPVSLFIALALLSFILARKRSSLYYLLFGLFTCLAIFTKDITGLAPLIIVFIYLALRWQWKELFSPLFISGLLLAIGPVIFWIWLDRNTLFNSWLNWNFLHLLKSPAFTVPWHYYLRAIATKYFYFLPFALYGGYLAFKEARRNKNYEFYLLIIWALFFPAAFSFGRQKLHYFIIPMYPAAALLVGLAGDKLLKEPVKLKIASVLKYLLIIAAILILFSPFKISSKRFKEAVGIAPAIDRALKELPEYEFAVYRYDGAAVLFYSQQLTRAKFPQDIPALEDILITRGSKPVVIFMPEQDFSELKPALKENCRVVEKYKDWLLVISPPI
ncbi:MAG: glycosyltransferase family 39 protein [Candidatus Omnitrophota bacterium]|jgi:4-amino-4-deoxy-L-arabinose transferase-like glycosyltransferase